MSAFEYHGRIFRGVENYDSGDLNADTRFHYRQTNGAVWATFQGGGVMIGTLVARIQADGSLDMIWQYLATDYRMVSGTCRSTLEVLPDGRYRLHESWKVTQGGDDEGQSVIEEIPA